MAKILITESVHPIGPELLTAAGHTVVYADRDMDVIRREIVDADAVLVRIIELPGSLLATAKNLKIVSKHGVGYDNIDLDYCKSHGIAVTITPNANSLSVAEHAFTLMLTLAKNIIPVSNEYRTVGFAAKNHAPGIEMTGKTLGLIGMGRIGKHILHMCKDGLDMHVIVYDPYISEVPEGVEKVDDLSELLRRADVVTLHCLLTDETRKLIDRERLALMKPTALLINCARGPIVDEAALIEALENGRLAGAGLDVTDPEPVAPDSPLFKLPNVIVTPHYAPTTSRKRKATMRLATIKLHGAEVAGIVTGKGILPVAALNAYKGTGWKEDMMSLIQANHIPGLTKWYNEGGKEELETIPGVVPAEEVVYAPLYRNPKRIFGIGLNYADHAKDIGNAAPTGFPGSFFKMADTLIGPNDDILLPKLKEAQKTTAEAELGIIMGRDCRDVPEEEWESAIVGYTTILDMTEESILKGNDFVPGNPRYLTIVKNFPTFFSFGPQLVTPDEVPDVLKLEVQSVHNGEIHAKNTVDHMTHVPSRLVSLHSSIQGWYAGDVLSTGTPRAFHIQDGDIAECRIVGPDGFEMEPLKNPVVDLKLH